MEMAQTHNVIIIGAGPAGVSIAYELQCLGISSTILERGDGAAYSWQQMPTFLRMVSSPAASTLGRDGASVQRYSLHRIPAHDFAAYVADFGRRFQLSMQFNTHVERLERQADGAWLLYTTRGVMRARVVINATGYISAPIIPAEFQSPRVSIPVTHFQRYKPHAIAPNARVLIVGKRLSAGQLLDELATRTDLSIELSARSIITYSKGHPWDKVLFAGLLDLEALLFKMELDPAVMDVKMMDGPGVQRLQQGKIPVRPQVASVDGATVCFSNGEQAQYDHIVLATGYRAALDHLPLDKKRGPLEQLAPDRFEVVNAPGLFLLGLESQVNYRSRFIRGFREDARQLAPIIAKNYFQEK